MPASLAFSVGGAFAFSVGGAPSRSRLAAKHRLLVLRAHASLAIVSRDMIASLRRAGPLLAALLALQASLLALQAPNALAAGPLAKAEHEEPISGAAVHFHRESIPALRKQLSEHAVREATFNVLAHHLHLLMDSRRLMLVNYQPKEKHALESELKAAGVTVTVEQASSTASHHRLRYIIGVLLIVAILAVLTVLLLGRRRKLVAERAS